MVIGPRRAGKSFFVTRHLATRFTCRDDSRYR
jgi:hypothetical protein